MREISEETGHRAQFAGPPCPAPADRVRLPASPNGGPLVFKRVHHFIVEAPSGRRAAPDPAEIAEAAWLGFDDARARLSFKSSASVLEAARRVLEGEPPRGAAPAHRRIGPACNSSTPPARRWCPSSRGADGSASMCAASRRTTRRTSAMRSSTTSSTCSTAASATRASRCAACATSPTSTTTSCASRANAASTSASSRTEQVRIFDHDMAAIGLLPVDVAPRATEHVAGDGRLDRAPRRRRLRLRGRRLGVLRFRRLPGLRPAEPPRPRDHDRAEPRARRRPGRPAQAAPARLRALAGICRRASRAGPVPGAWAGRDGTSSAP